MLHYRLSAKVWVPVLVCAALLALYLYTLPGRAPWTERGTLVVGVRAVPTSPNANNEFGIGFADVLLIQADGDTISTHLFTKRALLTVDDPALTELLTVPVPVGSYQGLSLRLSSPELRNDWRGEEAPESVSLHGEHVTIPTRFTIERDQTTVVLLGLETLQAMREQDGQLRYLPVIQAEVRAGSSVTNGPDILTVSGGTIEASATYGMSWDGDMRQNYRAPEAPPSEEHDPRLEFSSRHSIAEEPAPTPAPEATATTSSSSISSATTSDDVVND